MEFTLYENAKIESFAMIFQHIKFFTEQINVSFTPEFMCFQTMDKTRVSIVDVLLPAGWFDEYRCTETCTVGINTTFLFKVLNVCDKQQSLTIQYDNENADTLFVNILNKEGAGATTQKMTLDKHFEIPLMEIIDDELLHIPEIEYQAELSIPSSVLAKILSIN